MINNLKKLLIRTNFNCSVAPFLLIIFLFLLLPLVDFWRNFDFTKFDLTFFGADFVGGYFTDFVNGSQILASLRHLKPISDILWDPYNLLGFPSIGAIDRIGFFYPVKFLFYLISSFFSFKYQIFFATYYSLFHISLAGIFTYLFAKKCLKLDSFPSFVVGLIYSLSGSFIHLVIFTNTVTAPAFLPLELYFLWVALEKKSFKYTILAGFAYVPILVAGQPPMFLYNNIFIFSLLIFFFARDLKSFFRVFWSFFLANLMAIFISMVVLLPNMEVSRLAERQPFNLSGSASFPATAESILNFFIPHLYGVDKNGTVFGYIGILSLFLVFIALKYSNRNPVKFFAASAFFFLVLSLGNLTFLHAIFYKLIPMYGSFRRTAFLNYLTTFSLSFLAGWGLMVLEERKIDAEIILKHIGTIFKFSALLWVTLFILKPIFPGFVVANEMINSILPTVIFTVAGFLLIKYSYVGKSSYFKIFLVVIILVDLFTLNAKSTSTNSPLDPRVFNSKNALIKKFDDQLKNSYDRVYLNESTLRYNSTSEKIYQIDGYYGLTTTIYGILMNHYQTGTSWIDPNSPLLDILGVRYIFTATPIAHEDPKKIKLAEKMNITQEDYDRFMSANGTNLPVGTEVYAYENVDAMPRVYLVDQVAKAENDKEAESLMDRINLREAAVVTSSKDLPNVSLEKSKSMVSLTEYRNSYVKIYAETKGNALLVLSDAYFPGWKALVDGKETEIYKTNIALRGVFLEEGSHVVEFIYRPLQLFIGALISTVTFFVLLVALLIPWKKRRV